MKTRSALALTFLAFAPVGAMAETPEEKQACMDDAFAVCGHAIPDRDRVFVCMQQNVSKLSPTCRSVMSRYAPGSKTKAASSAPTNISPRMVR
jgi:hypothetical protein